MLAIPVLLFGQRLHKVLGRLAADARHMEAGVCILVALDPVATLAGVGEGAAGVGIANQRLRRGGSGVRRSGWCGGGRRGFAATDEWIEMRGMGMFYWNGPPPPRPR